MTLKILHCIHSLTGGGAERQLTILANRSHLVGMKFGIFCIDGSGNNLEDGACELFTLSDPGNYPWYLIKDISLAIRQFKPDIVHCWLPPSIIVPGMLAAKSHNIPVVSSYRNARDFGTWKDIAEWFIGLMYADAIVSNNPPSQSNAFFRYLYAKKISDQIPNAVNVPIKFRAQKMDRKTNDIFTILFVGRLVNSKNWQILLKSLSELKSIKPWKLLICGQGDDDRVKATIQNYELNSVVEMLGYRTDVYSVMADSDLLVLPSWYEGMPNVVLEAMSIGLPCVVSSIPAHTELLDETAVTFFEPSDSNKLTDILKKIINGDVDIIKLSKNGIDFSNKFTATILVERYLSFYNRVLAGR